MLGQLQMLLWRAGPEPGEAAGEQVGGGQA